MIKHNLLELLEDGETVVPLAGTDMAVLWRASLLDPGGVSYTRGHAARLTLIDLIPELFGIASLWLKVRVRLRVRVQVSVSYVVPEVFCIAQA